jgi:hypothetical protein
MPRPRRTSGRAPGMLQAFFPEQTFTGISRPTRSHACTTACMAKSIRFAIAKFTTTPNPSTMAPVASSAHRARRSALRKAPSRMKTAAIKTANAASPHVPQVELRDEQRPACENPFVAPARDGREIAPEGERGNGDVHDRPGGGDDEVRRENDRTRFQHGDFLTRDGPVGKRLRPRGPVSIAGAALRLLLVEFPIRRRRLMAGRASPPSA